MVTVEVKPEIISAFVERGWLSGGDVKDTRAVAEALEVLAECWAQGNLSEAALGRGVRRPEGQTHQPHQ